MNCITVVGNVGQDVEVRTVNTKDGSKQIANFSIADNLSKEKVNWWRCSVWEDDSSFKFVTGEPATSWLMIWSNASGPR